MNQPYEEKASAILEAYRGTPAEDPGRDYPAVPVEGVAPLFRIPKEMSFTEKIGGTEYTVTAHFRREGKDLLSMTGRLLGRKSGEFVLSEGYERPAGDGQEHRRK